MTYSGRSTSAYVYEYDARGNITTVYKGGTLQASYVDEFAEGGLDLVRALDKTSDGFTISNRLDGIKIHKSFMENGMRIPGSRLRVDGLDSIVKQLYELKPNNRNSLKKGVKQIINHNDELGGGYQMIIVLY